MPRNDRDGGVPQAIDTDSARRAAGRGLDWLNLFVANVQTGFGPFLAVYLTTAGWTQTSIGLALSLGTITAMASQVPAGALVDAIRSKSRVAIFSILAFTASALMFAVAPIPLFVYLGQVLHAFSSCTLGPAIVALSLAVAGQSALALRIGRNARFGAIGNAMGAALMGACGYYISERSVFLMTAALTLPAIVAIVPIARFADQPFPQVERRSSQRLPGKERIGRVLGDRRLLIFAGFVMLITLANAALLPLAGSTITKRAADQANLVIAASIVLPQLIMALISPTVGRIAEARGRRLVLLLGSAIFPLRGMLLAITTDPSLVVLFQLLDGIAAACIGGDAAARRRRYRRALGPPQPGAWAGRIRDGHRRHPEHHPSPAGSPTVTVIRPRS